MPLDAHFHFAAAGSGYEHVLGFEPLFVQHEVFQFLTIQACHAVLLALATDDQVGCVYGSL
jgi:hypothetical protein